MIEGRGVFSLGFVRDLRKRRAEKFPFFTEGGFPPNKEAVLWVF